MVNTHATDTRDPDLKYWTGQIPLKNHKWLTTPTIFTQVRHATPALRPENMPRKHATSQVKENMQHDE